ncbi:hypothetical protein QNO21_07580 [Microbacterium sp. zg-Y818]|uniref:hypothetical protein n=1 Tax=unclassified Microbacterium TaxID=2609290 RepID=UPI00214C88CF|nr:MULTISPECIES: hypothetical protein [unclassified Microbacterium]MCR2801165.1 hypothetical protein [Microbacterium sp. zg.Y818]WIM21001.1 hypothetical protein QNO21_07580 [Microbacterium sp. zg-Y818]
MSDPRDVSPFSFSRAWDWFDSGAALVGRAFEAHRAADPIQRELFAVEAEQHVQKFDLLDPEERDFILWVALSHEHRRARQSRPPSATGAR